MRNDVREVRRTLGHLASIIIQLRFARIQFVLSVLVLLVLLLRGVYRRFGGKNPYVYAALWVLPLISIFAGKWQLFEGRFFEHVETLLWTISDEMPVLGGVYWSISLAGILGYVWGKVRLLSRVKKCRLVQLDKVGGRWCEIRASEEEHSPFTVGTWHPYILLPADYESRYDEREREMILLHEKTHIHCCHNLLFGIAAFLRCLCWMNPIVYLGGCAFQTDMEIYCDGRVAEKQNRTEYGRLILKSAMAWEDSADVLQRVHFFFSQSQCKRRIRLLAGYQQSFQRYRKIMFKGICCLAMAGSFVVLSQSRWRVEESRGIQSVVVTEAGKENSRFELELTRSDCEKVIRKENEKEIQIDTVALRRKLKEVGAVRGTVRLWVESYEFGTKNAGKFRRETECNLYDSQNRFVTLKKEISGWKTVIRYL